jgi:hypothetical protein
MLATSNITLWIKLSVALGLGLRVAPNARGARARANTVGPRAFLALQCARWSAVWLAALVTLP